MLVKGAMCEVGRVWGVDCVALSVIELEGMAA